MDFWRKPLKFARMFWPDVTFYREQRLVLESLVDSDETYVSAGNMLGKDFVAGFAVVWFFLTRHPCRVVTTSAKADHLRVLWGEIGQYIASCKYPLEVERGGPLKVNHLELRKFVGKLQCPKSYVKGLVSSPDTIAAMQGHHIANTGDGVPRTMFVSDESSSVPDDYYKMASTWANRCFVFGNPWPCQNFFRRGVKAGDLYGEDGRCYRKVLKIKATDSPNVKLALAQKAVGQVPTNEVVVPGVKSWAEYQKNLATWDEVQKCVSLEAEFYEGSELLLFPPTWLNNSEQVADSLPRNRRAKAIGIDPAEGGDRTAMVAVDEFGVVDMDSRRTPDTNEIIGSAKAFARKHGVPAEMVAFDRGGGGKEHADRLRASGFNVRTVAFGESLVPDPRRMLVKTLPVKIDEREDRYAYVNRRAEMYGTLSLMMDPSLSESAFGIPREFSELRKQLAVMPKLYDEEGRMYMLAKRRPPGDDNKKKQYLVDLIGHSPDEADALVLAVYAMLHVQKPAAAGVYS